MVSLIGVHMTKAKQWPVDIPDHPQSVIKFKTCNRCQILTEKKDVKQVLKLFDGHEPEVWEDRECIRKLFIIATGMDSVSKGNPVIRQQMINARVKCGTPKLKRIVNDVVHITDRMFPPEPRNYIDACKQFLVKLGFYNVQVITEDNKHDESVYQCDAAILYAYEQKYLPNHFRFYMNISARELPADSRYIDLTSLYRWSRVQPISDIHPVADLYYDKMCMEEWKRNLASSLLNYGLSTRELEILFNVPETRYTL